MGLQDQIGRSGGFRSRTPVRSISPVHRGPVRARAGITIASPTGIRATARPSHPRDIPARAQIHPHMRLAPDGDVAICWGRVAGCAGTDTPTRPHRSAVVITPVVLAVKDDLTASTARSSTQSGELPVQRNAASMPSAERPRGDTSSRARGTRGSRGAAARVLENVEVEQKAVRAVSIPGQLDYARQTISRLRGTDRSA